MDRCIADSEFTAVGGELDSDALFFSHELDVYIQYMDWICAHNSGAGIDTCKAVIDKLRPFVKSIIVDNQFQTDSQNFISAIENADQWVYADDVWHNPSVRDFSESAKERLEELADKNQGDWAKLHPVWADLLIFLHRMGWGASPTGDFVTYDNDVTEMYNATKPEIDRIWQAVADVDQQNANTFDQHLKALTSAIKGLDADASSFIKLSPYKAPNYGRHTSVDDDPDVFDDWGLYGGNQIDMPSAPTDERSTCWDLAMTNTLLEKFKDDPKGFEKKFGIPLYVNGEFNYEGISDLYFQWIKKNHPACDQNNDLVVPDDVAGLYWEEFCKEHGVKVEVDSGFYWGPGGESYREIKVTPSTWKKKSKGGTIAVTFQPVVPIDPKTGKRKDYSDSSSHVVGITGVTKDKRYFIVSSWGKKYYLNPNDPAFQRKGSSIDFKKITYKK